jgi:single-stranded-DNA-specific exonuclease
VLLTCESPLSALAADARPVLGVVRSVSGRRWLSRTDDDAAVRAMMQRNDLSEVVARVMAGRGVGLDDVALYLDPTVKALMPDPSTIADMDAAASRIADAVTRGETVAIFGDYDVDGATSAAVVGRFLRGQGVEAAITIPDRIVDGYGPNPRIIGDIADTGATLLIAVDCGTSSFEAFAAARERGLDVVALDHHQAGVELPEVTALVNPNRQDDLSGLGHLAACGVAFLAMVAVNRALRRRGWYDGRPEPDLFALLDLVALGTVADVVPLKGLNRAFVAKGLLVLRSRANAGLAALADVARLKGPVSPHHLGFVLGPRINAGGRIGDAALGSRLLMTDDPDVAARIAGELDMLNRERQTIEAEMLAEAEAEVAGLVALRDPAVLVVASDRWHPGIVGLVASRLKERYERPAFAIAIDANGRGTGSGRSVAGVDLGRAVRAAVDDGLLEKGGGHAMAAGLTVSGERLADLAGYFEERLAVEAAAATGGGELTLDGALSAAGASTNLVAMLDRAGPYGAGNPEPLFAFPSHRVSYAEPVGQGHVRLSLQAGDGTVLKAMAFRGADRPLGRFLLESRGKPVHTAGCLSADHWQGETRVQLRVLDAADPATTRG